MIIQQASDMYRFVISDPNIARLSVNENSSLLELKKEQITGYSDGALENEYIIPYLFGRTLMKPFPIDIFLKIEKFTVIKKSKKVLITALTPRLVSGKLMFNKENKTNDYYSLNGIKTDCKLENVDIFTILGTNFSFCTSAFKSIVDEMNIRGVYFEAIPDVQLPDIVAEFCDQNIFEMT